MFGSDASDRVGVQVLDPSCLQAEGVENEDQNAHYYTAAKTFIMAYPFLLEELISAQLNGTE